LNVPVTIFANYCTVCIVNSHWIVGADDSRSSDPAKFNYAAIKM